MEKKKTYLSSPTDQSLTSLTLQNLSYINR